MNIYRRSHSVNQRGLTAWNRMGGYSEDDYQRFANILTHAQHMNYESPQPEKGPLVDPGLPGAVLEIKAPDGRLVMAIVREHPGV